MSQYQNNYHCDGSCDHEYHNYYYSTANSCSVVRLSTFATVSDVWDCKGEREWYKEVTHAQCSFTQYQ